MVALCSNGNHHDSEWEEGEGKKALLRCFGIHPPTKTHSIGSSQLSRALCSISRAGKLELCFDAIGEALVKLF